MRERGRTGRTSPSATTAAAMAWDTWACSTQQRAKVEGGRARLPLLPRCWEKANCPAECAALSQPSLPPFPSLCVLLLLPVPSVPLSVLRPGSSHLQ